jgi:hypothetical protein
MGLEVEDQPAGKVHCEIMNCVEDFPRLDFLVDDAFLAYNEAVVLAKVFSAKELSDAHLPFSKVRHKLSDDFKR